MKRIANVVINPFVHDSRVLRESLSLKKAGYEVTVVALHEGELPERENQNGLDIHRIKLSTRSWPKNRFFQLFKFAELFIKIAWKYKGYDIFHCNDVLPLPLAVLTKWFLNPKLKIVYDAHELEFDKSSQTSLTKMLNWSERFFIKYADKKITVTDGIADAYVEEYGVSRPAVVMNCPYFKKYEKNDYFRTHFKIKEEQIVFLYQGALGPHRGIEILLDGFSGLPDKYVIVFMGYGILEKSIKEKTKNYSNIFFHEAVPPEKLLNFTASADVGMYLTENTCRNHNLTLGNKLFQYIMAGVPVISSRFDAVLPIMERGVGTVLESYDGAGIQKAVRFMADNLDDNLYENLQKVAAEYNWEAQEQKLIAVYESLYKT